MSKGGQGSKCRRKIAENYNRLSRVHERYRRQTDGRATAYSEREREFAFANRFLIETPTFRRLSPGRSCSICSACVIYARPRYFEA